MTAEFHNNDRDLLAWETDSGPQWLGGALAALLWLIAAAFWRQAPILAGGCLLVAGCVAVTGALLPRLGDRAVIPRRIAPYLSVLAAALIAVKLLF